MMSWLLILLGMGDVLYLVLYAWALESEREASKLGYAYPRRLVFLQRNVVLMLSVLAWATIGLAIWAQ